MICEQPRQSTTDAMFALRMLMETYRDGQKESHCVSVDLEKAFDRVPSEKLVLYEGLWRRRRVC